MLSSFLLSLLLGGYFLIGMASKDSALLWARYSANLSFLYLFAAFSASTLNLRFKNQTTKFLLRNRRYFGLSFALAHSFHLAALIYFFSSTNDEPSMVFKRKSDKEVTNISAIPGDCYIANVKIPHCVLPCKSTRIHLLGCLPEKKLTSLT